MLGGAGMEKLFSLTKRSSQQQDKKLAEKNKSKTTIIQMFIENQNNLNKVDLESNSI